MYKYLFLIILVIVLVIFCIIPLWKQKPHEDFLTQVLNHQQLPIKQAYMENEILMDKIIYNGNIIPNELKKKLMTLLFQQVLRKTKQRIVPVDIDYIRINKYAGRTLL